MSSDKTPENEKQQAITRGKQSRRKMLKSMAAGSGAVIAGKAIPDQWAKPMVDSVLLPAHAQTSLSCTITGGISGDYQGVGDIPPPLTAYGPFTFPFDDLVTNESSLEIDVVPLISVTPGVTDDFTLTTTLSDAGAGAGDLSQNVTPDPVNGALAFNPIEIASDWSNTELLVNVTLTPDNAAFCGGPQVIEIQFGTE